MENLKHEMCHLSSRHINRNRSSNRYRRYIGISEVRRHTNIGFENTSSTHSSTSECRLADSKIYGKRSYYVQTFQLVTYFRVGT